MENYQILISILTNTMNRQKEIKKKIYSLLLTLLSFVIILLLWSLFAYLIDSAFVFPSVKNVFDSLKNILQEKMFFREIIGTLLRSLIAFLLSTIVSIPIGILSGCSKTISKLLALPLSVVKATPVVSFILCALFLFSTNSVPIFVAILMTMPIIISSVSTGIKNVDDKLLQMAKIFSFTKIQKLKYIYIPSVKSYLFSNLSNCFALSWKVVVAAEVLCLPKYSMGTALYSAKVHLETAEVYAISLVVVVLSFICEEFVSYIIKKINKGGYGDRNL